MNRLATKPAFLAAWWRLRVHLGGAGEGLAPLLLRLVLGWEFWEAGLEKFHGNNWFGDVQHSFPFPFNLIPVEISWFVATWFELIGALMLWLGLGTRFFAFSLLFLTFVATAGVHWPESWSSWSELLKGYSVSDRGFGNFKLPLLFSVMLLPLIFNGAGLLSCDHLLARSLRLTTNPGTISGAWSWAQACAVLGIPMSMLVPLWGLGLLALGLVLAAGARLLSVRSEVP